MTLAKNKKEWHRLVCERDSYKCRVCNTSYNYPYFFNEKGINQYVCGHHDETQGAHPELRLETDIGVCVDLGCHNKIHNGELTKQQQLCLTNK